MALTKTEISWLADAVEGKQTNLYTEASRILGRPVDVDDSTFDKLAAVGMYRCAVCGLWERYMPVGEMDVNPAVWLCRECQIQRDSDDGDDEN